MLDAVHTTAIKACWSTALLTLCLCGCGQAAVPPNPAAQGFNRTESDADAIRIADRVMARLGGRAAWDETRYLTWSLEGRRILWDKREGRARVERGSTVVVVDTVEATGRAWKRNGTEHTGPLAAPHVQQAHQAFVNDSYWLVMPFKLKDTGARLTTLGRRTSVTGEQADVLELTFKKVGYTPYNRFEVYVDRATDLIVQWNFFQRRVDAQATFSLPWRKWRRHGRIWLSASRGERHFDDLRVFDELPPEAFDGALPFDPASHPIAPVPES